MPQLFVIFEAFTCFLKASWREHFISLHVASRPLTDKSLLFA
jgi:hypothetical protein